MQKLLSALNDLKVKTEGDVFYDNISKILYATDASAYREIPLAVARPKSVADIKELIEFANINKVTLIPRTAGTSLAGQVVGNGIIVDVSKYFTKILEINQEEHWVRVQPGVVLDELNLVLEPLGLFFGPETSTSNRCMIGGMVGNNSCGSHSIIYGSTRDHLLEIKALLSDGSEVVFNDLTEDELNEKCQAQNLEGEIYRNIRETLSNGMNQLEIRRQFPDPELKRRNNGYAIDLLLETQPFAQNGIPFNFCKLIAGSEGTLAFMTEIKLNLVPLPPKVKGVICVHLQSVQESLHANLIALKYNPGAVELMDNVILNLTKGNITQQRNRFFVQGDPGAILIVEYARETKDEILEIYEKLVTDLKEAGYGYHYPILFDSDISKVWALRKSGLGVLSNMQGDAKPVSLVEDTAVLPKYLPDYIKEFDYLLKQHKLSCVYHAHIGSGELHLRPVLNLKDPKDVKLFHTIATETAKLVKKYRGSLSGEHGDGRLRGEFIPLMIGDHNYRLLRKIKKTWDPNHIFNAHKIVGTQPMNAQLRYEAGQQTREFKTYFDFSKTEGLLRATENCNGAGDCRKSEIIGGTMCPSFMATRDENASTRARANILREFLTRSPKKNPFDHKEIYEVMDLCLSCKGCKSECPSNVDMTKLKAEFLQHYYEANGIPFRTLAIAYINKINKIATLVPGFYNSVISNKISSGLIKMVVGFAQERSIPLLAPKTLSSWAKINIPQLNASLQNHDRRIWLFIDEFTNYNDVEIGKKVIEFLQRLGYHIDIPKHKESGRTFLSKGLLRRAKSIANKNVSLLSPLITDEVPLVGIEPSCILTFRDEYPELVNKELVEKARLLAQNALFIDEFLAREIDRGIINEEMFTSDSREIKLHGHCQQKALISTECTRKILSLPVNFKVTEIKSGCCGMAGSFGYEKEHYDLSMKVGELVLFPEVRNSSEQTLIAAPGTSCRHHIKDGTGRTALHPVEILFDSLNN
ncbi:MAG: FAD-linked oxidase C-terminal domain-containing protein [Bacteroidota bacterium]|nr:FAD-linked oxidase C-terminal domain-containing protein [Bacteroidota bacterium]